MRGLAPDDARWFGDAAAPTLRAAAHEITWLLDRGYPLMSAVQYVCDRHQLTARQRIALRRSVCSTAQRETRRARATSEVAGKRLLIDGFNLLVTLETAVSGGVLLEGADGALRDLAGLRGSYHLVPETEVALDAVARWLERAPPASIEWLLDAPVSNSARLRGAIEAHSWPCTTSARLVADPDRLLVGEPDVATSDGAVLDRVTSWIPLARFVVDAMTVSALRLRLGP